MQIETLKVFCDLVDRHSFSQSAARNFITQSAVSQQVKALESYFDASLLMRANRSVAPTEAGRLLYQAAHDVLHRLERLHTELKSIGQEIAGTVRVATVYSVGLYELSNVIKSFLKAFPKVNLHLEYRRPNLVYEDCLSRAVDLGIVAYPKVRKGLEVFPLAADRLVLICPPDHLFAGKRRIDIRKLDKQNFVGFEKDIPSREAIDKIFRQNGIHVNVVAEFDNIETIKRSVEIGAGLSIVPLLSVQREVKSGALVQVHFSRQTFIRPLGVILKRDHPPTAAAKKFIELLSQ